MGKVTNCLLAVCLVFSAAGCKTISKEQKGLLSKPVDCSEAEFDIRILESEKASVAKQTLSGVRMVLPVAAVAGILSGDYKNRWQVSVGQYNKDIDAKIAEIKNLCGLK